MAAQQVSIIMVNKKVYFISDFHLGTPNHEASLIREKRIVNFISSIEHEIAELYLVGDIFDFWFEHKYSVPKGFVRLLGKLAELSDKGIPLHIFTGNHDMWMYDYLKQEINAKIYHAPIQIEYNAKKFYIGHGDGLGPGDKGYKFIKKIFRNNLAQWFYARLHPNFSFGLANFFSRKSRAYTGDSDAKFLGEENEWLYIYCNDVLKTEHFDYFIFGHRHLPLDLKLKDNSRYINLGDWINYNTYAVFDGISLSLLKYEA
jgi:UDP-2,3-diacylglucosamine hydrolase